MPKQSIGKVDNLYSLPQNGDNTIHAITNISREEQIAARDEFLDYFTDVAAREIFKRYKDRFIKKDGI